MTYSPIKTIATRFLNAFPRVEQFEIGIRLAEENSEDGQESMRIQTVTRKTILSLKYLKFLKAMNAQNRHIYIRPVAPHAYTLIDDVLPFRLGWAEDEGLQPSVVIETSPDNFQFWLYHGEILSETVSTQAAKLLSEWFDGDPSSADFRHFGRFPGFTNPKPKYLINGVKPFSKLSTASHRIYDKAQLVRDTAIKRHQDIVAQRDEQRVRFSDRDREVLISKSWDDFYQNPKYSGDHNRVDLAYSIYALSNGLSLEDVMTTLRQRNLSHKGSASRQHEYVERTIKKANTIIASRR